MSNNSAVVLSKINNKLIGSNTELQTFYEDIKALTIPLIPETLNFGVRPELKLSATLVTVDTQVDQSKNNRDIYSTDGGKFALHLTKLNEIAQAAGLRITDSRIIERQTDDQGLVIYISHQMKWEMKSIDGSMKDGTVTGKYDYMADLADQKAKKKTEAQIIKRRRHADALAESNCLTRAISKALAKLPQSFSLEELKKPFLVPCVTEDKRELLKGLPPEAQAELKKMEAARALGLLEVMYPQQKREVAPDTASFVETPADTTPQSHSPSTPAYETAQVVEETTMSQTEMNKIIAGEFRDASQQERTEKILALAKLTGYKLPGGKEVNAGTIERSTLEKQISTIEYLLNLQAEEGDTL